MGGSAQFISILHGGWGGSADTPKLYYVMSQRFFRTPDLNTLFSWKRRHGLLLFLFLHVESVGKMNKFCNWFNFIFCSYSFYTTFRCNLTIWSNEPHFVFWFGKNNLSHIFIFWLIGQFDKNIWFAAFMGETFLLISCWSAFVGCIDNAFVALKGQLYFLVRRQLISISKVFLSGLIYFCIKIVCLISNRKRVFVSIKYF